MKKFIILVLSVLVTLSANSQTTESEKLPSEKSMSRAWYVMRQMNAGPLLLGLAQRLGKAIENSNRGEYIWTGIEQGGILKLDIAVEGQVPGEILVGFFENPDWSSRPVQVRSFPGPGEYAIENLPPGKFHIGAMIGSLPVAIALGIERKWPEPVVIEKGKSNSADVLVSSDFQKRSSGWYNNEVSKDFIGDWEGLDTNNLLQGHLTGPGGKQISFGEIMIREYNPDSRRGIAAPDRGTNEEGYYKFDGIKWPYFVIANRKEMMPSVFGYRYQQMLLNRVLEGSQTVDFEFPDYPAGTSSVTGVVSDQGGMSLSEFIVDVGTIPDTSEKLKNQDGKYYTNFGYRQSFISKEGSFTMTNLPSGVLNIRVIPFDMRAYELQWRQGVTLEPDKTTNINLKVISKNLFYGRVLFEDGTPAIIKPEPWNGASTSILIPTGGLAGTAATLDDEGYFRINLSDREIEWLKSGSGSLIINVPTDKERTSKTMGNFPFDLLAKDKSKAGVFKISRPEPEPKPITGKSLPELIDLGVTPAPDINDKTILVCFFDIDQRPSRNCILELSKKAKELKAKDIEIIAIHSSNIEQEYLDKWLNEYSVDFSVGIIKSDEEQTKYNWGVKALPWLILTDKNHIVQAEGFSINELDVKIKEIENAKQ